MSSDLAELTEPLAIALHQRVCCDAWPTAVKSDWLDEAAAALAFLSARGVVVLDREQVARWLAAQRAALWDTVVQVLPSDRNDADALIAALTGPTAGTPVRQPSPSGFVSTEGEDQAATAPYRGLSTEADLLAVSVGTVITGPDWHEEVYLKTDVDEWCPPDPEAAWTSKSLVARGPFSVALTEPTAPTAPSSDRDLRRTYLDEVRRTGPSPTLLAAIDKREAELDAEAVAQQPSADEGSGR